MASRPALQSPIVGLPQYPASERSAEEVLRDTDDFFAGQGPVHRRLQQSRPVFIASSRSKS